MLHFSERDSIEGNEDVKYIIVTIYCLILLLYSMVLDNVGSIVNGISKIVFSPDTLITDYIQVGGHGAAFFNAGFLALIILYMLRRLKAILTGPAIAAVFTVAGFGLFGKNLYNIWPIIFGVWLYGKLKKESFKNNILIALFGTALSPIVSEITFAMDLNIIAGATLGIIVGVLVGMSLPPLSRFFVGIHQGYNLYNIGFTAGFIGTIIMSLLRAFGLSLKGEFIWSVGQSDIYFIPSLIYFGSMVVLGWFISPSPINKLKGIIKRSGRIVTDFVIISGFGATLLNMGLMGIIGTLYLYLISGDFNGPTLGAILTMAGFGAFGTHPRNALPIMAGVFAVSKLSIWSTNSPGTVLAALFGTTLAPIAGAFGWAAGLAAGILHLTIVMNVGYLHGGLNLYNNGFSGGIVAIIMLPILEALKKEE